MSKQPKSTNSVGTVTMVSVKFAYVSTPKGTVFCPLAASVPPDELVPDMRQRYTVGDSVYVQAVPQDAKNGCALRAKKMRHAKTSCPTDPTAGGDGLPTEFTCFAVVGNIRDAYFIADSAEHGSVFVPQTILGRSFFDIEIGDYMEMKIRSQPERNNCRWVAFLILDVSKAVSGPSTSTLPFEGFSLLRTVEPMAATFESQHGTVFCPILTWMGGDMGTEATGLDEILRPGDMISYEAEFRDGVWRAVRWSPASDRLKPKKKIMDAYTQTVPSLQDFAVKIAEPYLRDLAKENPSMNLILNALEESVS